MSLGDTVTMGEGAGASSALDPHPGHGRMLEQPGSWELDLRTLTGRFSPAMFRILGRDPALGTPSFAEFAELVHPDDRPVLMHLLRPGSEVAQPISFGYRTDPRRGPVRHLDATLYVEHDAAGEPVRSFGTVVDVTERMRTQAEVARLAAIVESSDDAIIGLDLASNVTSWNRGAERLFGYPAAAVIGGPVTRIVPPERRAEEQHILERIQAGDSVAHFTTERVAADGRRVHVSVAASPMRDAQGRIFGVSKILRDVTALRQHELEIDRLSRLYAALSHVNQAIVVTAEQNALFEKVCRALVESGGFHMAWVGWHEPATERILPVASWGDDTGYLSGIRVYADQRAEGLGPSGTAFREARPYICNDMLADPATLPWRSEIARRGFRASAVFPIREAGAVRGTLSVYADEPHFFQDREVALLMEAADDVSFALENFQRDAARRAVERTLREERDFSDAVLNSLPGVLYLYDEHGRFLRWNHNFERVSGYSPEEIVAMHPLDFYRGDDRARVAARIEEVFARGESSVEADFVGKDGQRTPYFFTGVLTEVGGQRCLVGVGIDIAERRRAEAARTLIEGRYRTLFEHAPDGILIADPHGVYVDANASVCTLLDYRPEELIGLSAADIVHTSEQVEIAPALATIHARGSYHREWRFKRRDGTKVAAEVTATLLPDGNVLAMLRDVTERNAAEAALRELNETLEHKVVERTGQLQAALVRAESADKLKSAFLATMSHELRTPLNSIIGFTGILLQGLAGPLTAEQSKQLTMVRGSGRHLLDLINDVLDLSKIEADQLLVRTERFALGASLERALATVRPLADKKGLRLCAELSDDLDEMVSDQRRVEQILINLLNNAIKFTDSGTVTLRAERLPRSPLHARPRLRVEVLDTGIGIKPEDLGRLFQPFSQIDTGLSRVHEGTGLGLAICRRLAGLLGGEIGARSNRPNGSVFTVILPLMER